mmetsp:Transcript_29076/g.41134  ORF Transcript_29076/g.41134 Transcript_29076/m.41134 type:complete len:110 (+) Transcript_29076:144-473(+)
MTSQTFGWESFSLFTPPSESASQFVLNLHTRQDCTKGRVLRVCHILVLSTVDEFLKHVECMSWFISRYHMTCPFAGQKGERNSASLVSFKVSRHLTIGTMPLCPILLLL